MSTGRKGENGNRKGRTYWSSNNMGRGPIRPKNVCTRRLLQAREYHWHQTSFMNLKPKFKTLNQGTENVYLEIRAWTIPKIALLKRNINLVKANKQLQMTSIFIAKTSLNLLLHSSGWYNLNTWTICIFIPKLHPIELILHPSTRAKLTKSEKAAEKNYTRKAAIKKQEEK